MISIERNMQYGRRTCQCCFSEEDVKEIYFRNDRQGVVVALCKKCRCDLRALLEQEEEK